MARTEELADGTPAASERATATVTPQSTSNTVDKYNGSGNRAFSFFVFRKI
jgi:hypothetical protein